MPNTEPDSVEMSSDRPANVIHVVAAIIWNSDKSRILISKRLSHAHQGGLWEFPGGKVERGERPEDALARELLEELNLDIDLDSIEKYSEINHHYPDKAVHLEFWQIYSFAGEPMGVEGQELSWVEPRGLLGYDFPRANQKVVRRLVSSGY